MGLLVFDFIVLGLFDFGVVLDLDCRLLYFTLVELIGFVLVQL